MTTTLVTEILIEMCVVGEGAGLYALFNTEVSRDTLKSCGLTHLDLLYLIPHWLDDLLEDENSYQLWNLFLPLESDPDQRYGGGLTNLEYAHLAAIMGQSVFASEVSHQQDGVGFVETRTHTPISVVGQRAQCQVWYSCRISTVHVVSRHQGQSNITRL